MLNKKYFQQVRQDLISYAEKRREVIKAAGDAQHHAKRAIFALQRGNKTEAADSFSAAEAALLQLRKKFAKEEDLFDEGSYRAALEEYTEAALFKQFLEGKELDKIKTLPVDSDIFIGGLADVPGEMVRYALKAATERQFDEVKRCYVAAEQIIAEMISMDLTGYNRQKFDQAKQALQKLEQIVYELSLKK